MGRLIGWVVVALLGCGEGVRQAEPVACDPLADEGCEAGSHCRVLAGGATACLAVAAAAGPGCTPATCAPGEACVEVEGLRACQPLCDLEAGTCGDGGVCAYGLAADRPWGLCPRPCALGTCGDGATCAPTTATPYPICVATGGADLGAPCDEARCGAGLACLLRDDVARCARLCAPSAPDACPGRCNGLIEGLGDLRFCVDEAG